VLRAPAAAALAAGLRVTRLLLRLGGGAPADLRAVPNLNPDGLARRHPRALPALAD
jgi:hypothetical protein